MKAVRGVLAIAVALVLGAAPLNVSAQEQVKVFISVDMEGIGGVGTGAMASSSGKDYGTARQLMTAEVNTVIEEIFARDPGAEILLNDSHGDMQNILHLELDPRVRYIQGAIKPLGMVQGLDASFDGAIFIGYHAKAGDPDGFLAHTGTGSVKGLWLNGIEVGEGGMNAAYAGSHGVPVILAAGDSAAAAELHDLLGTEVVATKSAETPASARLIHPERVRDMLRDATRVALQRLDTGGFEPFDVGNPVVIRMRFTSTTHVDVLQSIPGVRKVDGYTIEYSATNATEAYKLIRLMYRFVRV